MHQLQHLGHTPVDGGEGGEAVGAGGPYDAVVVEPAFPPARTFASLLAEARPDVPIVVVSTQPRSQETATLRPAAYVVKPVLLDQLRYAVDEALRNAPSSAR